MFKWIMLAIIAVVVFIGWSYVNQVSDVMGSIDSANAEVAALPMPLSASKCHRHAKTKAVAHADCDMACVIGLAGFQAACLAKAEVSRAGYCADYPRGEEPDESALFNSAAKKKYCRGLDDVQCVSILTGGFSYCKHSR